MLVLGLQEKVVGDGERTADMLALLASNSLHRVSMYTLLNMILETYCIHACTFGLSTNGCLVYIA
jgi:hypothetical protein